MTLTKMETFNLKICSSYANLYKIRILAFFFSACVSLPTDFLCLFNMTAGLPECPTVPLHTL